MAHLQEPLDSEIAEGDDVRKHTDLKYQRRIIYGITPSDEDRFSNGLTV